MEWTEEKAQQAIVDYIKENSTKHKKLQKHLIQQATKWFKKYVQRLYLIDIMKKDEQDKIY